MPHCGDKFRPMPLTLKRSDEPPRLAFWLLQTLLPSDTRLLFLGDLDEEYAYRLESTSQQSAQRWYWQETRKAILPILIDQLKAQWHLLHVSYFAGLRIWKKERLFGLLELFSLGVGLAVMVLIFNWAQFELNFDRFHEKGDRLFRVITHSDNIHFPISPEGMAPLLQAKFPEVTQALRMSPPNQELFMMGRYTYALSGVLADSNFFDFFTYPLIEGNPGTALSQPYSIVISQSLAKRLFPGESAFGKQVKLKNFKQYTITGILKDPPKQSHLKFKFIKPFVHEVPQSLKGWELSAWTTYVEVKPNTKIDSLETKMTTLLNARVGDVIKRLWLQPVKDIHLRSTGFQWDLNTTGDVKRVWLIIAAAIAIFIMACVNVVNLSLARGGVRFRAFRMRRMLGASQWHLFIQAMGQSWLTSIMSIGLALGFIFFFHKKIEHIVGWTLSDLRLFAPQNVFVLLMMGLLLGLASTLIPLWIINYSEAKAWRRFPLHGHYAFSKTRKNLVVLQMIISMVFVLITIFVSRQIDFMLNYPLGFDVQSVYSFRLWPGTSKVAGQMQEALLKSQAITGTSVGHMPIYHGAGVIPTWEGQEDNEGGLMYHQSVDTVYLDFYGLRMLKGRFFKAEDADGPERFVINEAAAHVLGPDSVIGKWIQLDKLRGEVIGIVNDFHYKSLHYGVQPCVLHLMKDDDAVGVISFRVKEPQIAEGIEYARNVYKKFSDGKNPIISSMERPLVLRYAEENKLKQFVQSFCMMAVIVAALGVFGISAYTAERRRHEFVVKKVFGAHPLRLVREMSMAFTKWVLLGLLGAIPIAYLFLSKWLSQFVRHVKLDWQILLISSVSAWLFVFLIGLYWAVKTVNTAPTQVLRDE